MTEIMKEPAAAPHTPMVEVNHLKKYFKTKRGLLHAVDDVSFSIERGETLGLVGESGCGKSTLGRTMIRLLDATSGEVKFDGRDILKFSKSEMKEMRKKVQIVFQDPYSCLNPRLSVADLIAEPLIVNKVYSSKKAMNDRILELMDTVGLARRLIGTYPHELDGGRRQRIGIARSLALNPDFIVLDEPVSALDVCIQAQVLNLLCQLQRDNGYTYVFISHDLSVVKHLSDRIAVMYLGSMVELTGDKEIFKNPLHPYTQALLSAIPIPKVGVKRERILLEGDVPSPVNPPAGCRFAGRCRFRKDICTAQTPELKEVAPNHFVACHLVKSAE
ncbi:oligopeptide/dipeptide ABC transporter, ATP-binding protein [Jonquetella anthropi DSM 22815]|uniref:Oligopeptide/dipeptide ABC transporter, ATP-binding protein n=3 Tax=Jonquetella TaxID=428711 RepID=H0UKX1_9BACT|nr:oligopeptide/dipeptide ABC transporter ATP-binding protein [Jonquetella anthropi]EEX47888.1 ABC transporter, ATP-binding protein [Jonquetella anthropi E3_33 E1]EHM13330.1 oligopeptide/dipeptide ABC transporter, ATP-binding protein [Jonquetella anthropi DSM 22815]